MAGEKRRPGRPKGATNKRSRQLGEYLGSLYGGSAAQQMAAVCMVTPAEVRKAGSVLAARVAKAQVLAEALKIKTAEAWDLMARELAALAPYTDQRQPLAIEAKGQGFAPSVVVQVESLHQAMPAEAADAEFVEVFSPAPAQVARFKSHGEGQAPDPVDLFGPQPAD